MFKKPKLTFIVICLVFQLLTIYSCKIKEDTQSTEINQLTEEQAQLVEQLNQLLIPLNASPLDLTDNDLSFLDQVNDARIVGLGEATHGTKEFFRMKYRIFRYLVENCQHKIFAFEADYAESIYINNYVTKGEGDLDDLMVNTMHFWTWRTLEVKQLLEWMREYNIGKADEDKIQYFGFDNQIIDDQPALLQEYLQPILPDLWATYSAFLEQLRNYSYDDFEVMEAATYNDLKAQLELMEAEVIANKELLIASSSPYDYEINKRLVTNLLQCVTVKYHYSRGNSGINYRDIYMAENTLWIADLFGQDTKITLWAHNIHLSRDESYSSMGLHLDEALNDLYRVIGFGFSKGTITAVGYDANGNGTGLATHTISFTPKEDSTNYIFHHASHPDFALHLDAIPIDSLLYNWLNQMREYLTLGAVFYTATPGNHYYDSNLIKYYDWILYFRETNATERL
ncbi:MAG: erythromycin esterase family protein [bacterium]|nr:erythromycin esterase family protein [bacterium]